MFAKSQQAIQFDGPYYSDFQIASVSTKLICWLYSIEWAALVEWLIYELIYLLTDVSLDDLFFSVRLTGCKSFMNIYWWTSEMI